MRKTGREWEQIMETKRTLFEERRRRHRCRIEALLQVRHLKGDDRRHSGNSANRKGGMFDCNANLWRRGKKWLSFRYKARKRKGPLLLSSERARRKGLAHGQAVEQERASRTPHVKGGVAPKNRKRGLISQLKIDGNSPKPLE